MIYSQEIISGTQISVWKLEETQDELLAMLTMDSEIEEMLSLKSATRRLEKLAVRVLIKKLVGEQLEIEYHNSGIPYLKDSSQNIGISHTKGYVAVALNPNKSVGLDIEYMSEKVRRVQSRIVSDKEYIDENKEQVHLLLHWSTKEAMYKVLGESGVDYLKHLYVKPFTPTSQGFCQAEEIKTSSRHCFDEVYYRVYDDFVLVCLSL